MDNEQTGRIIALALITIVMAIYTLLGFRWWLKNMDRLPKRLVAVLWLASIAFLIFAPGYFLGYLMNDVKLVAGISSFGRCIVLMAWIVPGVVYGVVYRIRQDRSKR